MNIESATKTVLSSPNVARMGATSVTISAMRADQPTVFLAFSSGHYTGMQVTFHGTADEMRAFAVELIRHAEAADAAYASRAEAGQARTVSTL
ncbi:hypothetical protein [Dyella sp. RRB7]|uniref:hypothetical protein n=1 Tax=Dyella sp. RRB7 TaxID=2919502 RepID=UPI001FA984D2|nr:hypothetical protein [Dyella sp. RRB7]